MNHKSGTIQTDITGTNKPISLAQFDPIYPLGGDFFLLYLAGLKIEEIIGCLKSLKKEVAILKKEDAFLKECLAKYGNPKDSRNSSTPPSKDENRPKANQSLCKPSCKRVGRQKGRERKTFEMTVTPDKIVEF
ncbi:MAG: hypothetical protein CVU08_12335 [Bacteroidetes bacterium HGW-Bacteroidetes-3]|jgi:hypothetical protein|nr:MAG: hypothetical protein CVU08_12335 [Bacteroidetes bacterium HGW-Bacteroidetes-3]